MFLLNALHSAVNDISNYFQASQSANEIEVMVDEKTLPSFLKSINDNPMWAAQIKKLHIHPDSERFGLETNGIFTDSELEEIVNRCPNLEILDLYRCLTLTERGLQCIGRLPKLKSLTLSCLGSGLTDNVIISLNGIEVLTHLKLRNASRITDHALKVIAEQHIHLENLNIQNCKGISDGGIAALIALKHLKTLNILGCEEVSDQGLRYIQSMKQLNKLVIGCQKNTTRKERMNLFDKTGDIE